MIVLHTIAVAFAMFSAVPVPQFWETGFETAILESAKKVKKIH